MLMNCARLAARSGSYACPEPVSANDQSSTHGSACACSLNLFCMARALGARLTSRLCDRCVRFSVVTTLSIALASKSSSSVATSSQSGRSQPLCSMWKIWLEKVAPSKRARLRSCLSFRCFESRIASIANPHKMALSATASTTNAAFSRLSPRYALASARPETASRSMDDLRMRTNKPVAVIANSLMFRTFSIASYKSDLNGRACNAAHMTAPTGASTNADERSGESELV
mmetsp:Transcript_16728/g.50225  ORF Transcript_16728/g.50225 Transcript_16728/m.50225 type:complete len:230 (-) Transcript_16728:754-1443(-)